MGDRLRLGAVPPPSPRAPRQAGGQRPLPPPAVSGPGARRLHVPGGRRARPGAPPPPPAPGLPAPPAPPAPALVGEAVPAAEELLRREPVVRHVGRAAADEVVGHGRAAPPAARTTPQRPPASRPRRYTRGWRQRAPRVADVRTPPARPLPPPPPPHLGGAARAHSHAPARSDWAAAPTPRPQSPGRSARPGVGGRAASAQPVSAQITRHCPPAC